MENRKQELVGKVVINKNDKTITVIVETDKGMQFGKVVTDILEIDEKEFDKIVEEEIEWN